MGDETFAEALQTMMNAGAGLEERILAARYLACADQRGYLDALEDICRDQDADPELAEAAARSLARVAVATDREDAIDPATFSPAARQEYTADAA